MCVMDKVKVPHIESQLRLNRSVKTSSTDKSLFYLYLSMLEKDLSNQPRFADRATTDEIVYADIESHYYKHPALTFTEQDYQTQTLFCDAIEKKASVTLQFLNAFFPQGLAEKNDPSRLNDDVVQGLDYYAKQRLAANLTANKLVAGDDVLATSELPTDETMLFDLIPKASEFSW